MEDGAPNSNFFKLPELSETSRARKLILGLHVNIDNDIIYIKPIVADMTLPGRCKDPQFAHQCTHCTVSIVRSQVQVQMSSVELCKLYA